MKDGFQLSSQFIAQVEEPAAFKRQIRLAWTLEFKEPGIQCLDEILVWVLYMGPL
jgi:hypothetical protein